jgi:Na+/proline symporter
MIATLIVLLGLPLAIGLMQRRGGPSLERFRTNRGGNGLIGTTFGVVAGNVGIGTFLAIYSFAAQSPLIATAVVVAYTAGLLLCAGLAPLIRRRSAAVAAVGLVDMIVATHGVARPALIWLPVAAIFVLRSAVQLAALGLLLVPVLGWSAPGVIALSAAVMAAYLAAGGYRAAVGTDIAQAAIILAVAAVAATGLAAAPAGPARAFDLGPYGPALLVGIALFLPFSAVLAVDNWQRITVARSDGVAQAGFAIAALLCAGVYVVIAVAGWRAAPGADVFAAFAGAMPAGLGWLATILFVACIMSSIDTFLMPLVTSLGPGRSLLQLRAAVVGLMAATAATAIALGDVLDTVIAAFNGLTVLIPAAAGALMGLAATARAAVLSVTAGFAVSLATGLVAAEIAAMAGFAVAAAAYAGGLPRR